MNEDFEKLNRMSQSPIHEHKGVWYFWNETWSERIGSYTSKAGAEAGLENYLQEIQEDRTNKAEIENKKWDQPYP